MKGKSTTASYEAEIERLQAENEKLRTQVTAVPLSPVGIYTVKMPDDTSHEAFKQAYALWTEVWKEQGVEEPPALIAFPSDVSIEQVIYNGFGIFVIKLPDDTPIQAAQRWACAWDAAWQATTTPNAPVVFLTQSAELQDLSDQHLELIGLRRIPDQRVGHA